MKKTGISFLILLIGCGAFCIGLSPFLSNTNLTQNQKNTYLQDSYNTAVYSKVPVKAEDDGDDELNKSIEEIVDKLNKDELDKLLGDLDQEQIDIFGTRSFSEKIKAIIDGEDGIGYDSIFGYLAAIFFGSLKNILPFMLTILGICAVFSVVNSIKSDFASSSTGNIIRFACIAVIAVILFTQIFSLITSASKTINAMSRQINTVFPIILTMMAATGATGSVAAYTPAVAILGNVLSSIITLVVLPCFILAIVFDIVGNLSDAVRLKKMSGFFMGTLKWVLGTAFFVFLAFLSVKGITASVRDGVSIRSAKFAISNYIPIIGGYLSEGFNMVMAGSVLIKNAVGLSSVVLLFLTVAPLIAGIMVFSLSLSFLGALVEPMGLGGISSIMTGIGKTLKSLTAIILGMTFLYFVFLMLTVCTGNLVL